MHSSLRVGGIALALCANMGLVFAQGNQPSGPPAAEQRPVPSPRLPTQPPGAEAENAKPSMLKPEHAATPDSIAEQVPGSTRQTMPSTISAENAAQDKLPIMQLPLTDEQKNKIAASLAKASVVPVGGVRANVTQSLPSGVMLQEFPAAATAEVPAVARYKYVKLPDRVLIVDPPFRTVVGEIKQ